MGEKRPEWCESCYLDVKDKRKMRKRLGDWLCEGCANQHDEFEYYHSTHELTAKWNKMISDYEAEREHF